MTNDDLKTRLQKNPILKAEFMAEVEERAAIREYDGGMSPKAAYAAALDEVIQRWKNDNR
jgi:hypothetical protein